MAEGSFFLTSISIYNLYVDQGKLDVGLSCGGRHLNPGNLYCVDKSLGMNAGVLKREWV